MINLDNPVVNLNNPDNVQRLSRGIVESKDIWLESDKATAREVWRDVRHGIKRTIEVSYKRLWVITNCNVKALNIVLKLIEKTQKDPQFIQLGIEVKLFRPVTTDEEIQIRMRERRENIPTVIIQSYVTEKLILEL